MIVYFVRHGESLSNAGLLEVGVDDNENAITEKGVLQIKSVAAYISGSIGRVYTSPLRRVMASAEVFSKNRSENLKIVADIRLREIDYGDDGDAKDSPRMQEVSRRQVEGDYDVRFGETGENKREIVNRFYSFLVDLIGADSREDVVVFSHGRAISIVIEWLRAAGVDLILDSNPAGGAAGESTNGRVRAVSINEDSSSRITNALNSFSA